MLKAMNREQPLELQVFIEAGCQVCERALRLAQEVDGQYPELVVQVIDVNEPAARRRDDVFAVPTFVLNGQVFSLGNPRDVSLRQAIESLLPPQDSV